MRRRHGLKLSSVIEGKVLDWKWKKRKTDTLFYIGDIYIGQLFFFKNKGWSALHRLPQSIGLVEGFKTRYAASNFLLKFEVINEGIPIRNCPTCKHFLHTRMRYWCAKGEWEVYTTFKLPSNPGECKHYELKKLKVEEQKKCQTL